MLHSSVSAVIDSHYVSSIFSSAPVSTNIMFPSAVCSLSPNHTTYQLQSSVSAVMDSHSVSNMFPFAPA